LSGVSVTAGGNPILRRNRINKNAWAGIRIYEQGTGTFEENDLKENIKGAWEISEDSKAKVKLAKNIDK
jgi:parallel beta-helix repeat protein